MLEPARATAGAALRLAVAESLAADMLDVLEPDEDAIRLLRALVRTARAALPSVPAPVATRYGLAPKSVGRPIAPANTKCSASQPPGTLQVRRKRVTTQNETVLEYS